MADPQLLSYREMGQLFGVSERTIRTWLTGLLPDERGGKGQPNKYSLLRAVEYRWGKPGRDPTEDPSRLDLEQERARLAAEQADKIAMDNAQRRGELAPLEYFDAEIAAYTAAVASALDAVPMRIRQSVPHLTQIDHATIERLLADERARLADRLARGAYEDRPEPGEDGAEPEDSAAAAAERVG